MWAVEFVWVKYGEFFAKIFFFFDLQIDDDSPCMPNYSGEGNPFCMENIDVSNFLNLHSLGNHEDFCLAYVFTYRDFNGGTLGLAWVASASGTLITNYFFKNQGNIRLILFFFYSRCFRWNLRKI